MTDVSEVMFQVMEKETGGLSEYFDVIITSFEMKTVKTDGAMFRKVLEDLNEKTENCIFIDDRFQNIETAEKLGFKTILYKNNEQLFKELEKYSI